MRVAAMDLGSNSFHLLVADVHPDGHIDPLVQEKEMLRLGDVVSRHGAIPLTAADQAVATVRRFRLLAEAAGATEILAKATAAIRRAANGGEVVDRIRAETGVHVDVISGLEEARLIFGAVRASVVLDPAPALCFDLGGGSLEVMVGDASSLMWATSVPLGVARLSAELVSSDPISKRDRRALREHIEAVLAPVVAEVGDASSRSSRSAAAARSNRWPRWSRPGATRTRPPRSTSSPSTAASSSRCTRTCWPRRPPIACAWTASTPGASTSSWPARWCSPPRWSVFDFDQLTISEWALREGIVLDAVAPSRPRPTGPTIPHSIRGSAVLSLARRCNWSEPHARQVAKLSLDLFDATAALHGLDAADRELLEFAALLHDIGEHVASSGHHKHGAYLVRNGQLRGFAPTEVELLAAVVRWHRRGEPRVSDEFPLLDAAAIERVRALAAILRVADGLDRSRNQNVYGLDAMITPSLVLLRVRALDDAELEIWGARRKRALLEKVLDRELELTDHPAAG